MPQFVQRSTIDASAEEVYGWHARRGAFERLVPPWEQLRVVERQGGIADGDRMVIELRRGPLRVRWTAMHRDHHAGRQFRDVQIDGPFGSWTHTHRFIPDGPRRSVLEDEIDYRLPYGPLGPLLGGIAVHRTLARTFRYRHARIRDDLARHQRVADRGAQRVVVSGASGLVGQQLTAFLTTGGHRVDRLVRDAPHPGSTDVAWHPERGELDAAALEGADAVVHLAGESIAAGRWTPERKRAILESRTQGTSLLAETLARLDRRPRVLISASAIGFYGDRGDQLLTEQSPPGDGFLADVCRAWEAAAASAARAGIRVVTLRLGVVLSARGGALARMLIPFRLGAGGVIGSGLQYLSWIHLDDVIGAIYDLMFADAVSGPVNAVAPTPVTNAELTRTLATVLGRPAIVPLPAAAARLVFGEMGQALLLDGARVAPARLTALAFAFLHPNLEGALRTETGA